MPEAVFRSDSPAVLAVWDEWKGKRESLRAFADELEKRHGRGVLERRSSFTGVSIVGLKPTDADRKRGAELPEGFRLGVKEGYLCPDKRTKTGREIGKELFAHRVGKPTYPGMPDEFWGSSDNAFQTFIYSPGFERTDDGFVYATWGCSAERLTQDPSTTDRNAGTVNLSIWEHVPLSAYYAMRETAEVTA